MTIEVSNKSFVEKFLGGGIRVWISHLQADPFPFEALNDLGTAETHKRREAQRTQATQYVDRVEGFFTSGPASEVSEHLSILFARFWLSNRKGGTLRSGCYRMADDLR